MATYYVRKTGSDANAGTSAGAAWLTIGKALGAAGIASGDTVYIGAGVYREAVTVAMTSATVETFVIGDVDGKYTGDAGEVQWSMHTTNDKVAPPGTVLLTLSGRDFLTFKNICFQGGGTANGIIDATSVSSTDIKIIYCAFYPQRGALGIRVTSAANVALNWVVDSCTFMRTNSDSMLLTLTRPATADFDYNVQIKNCVFIGGSASGNVVLVQATGANTFNGGGVDVYNCFFYGEGAGGININGANLSTSIPCTVYNCYINYPAAQALLATSLGQLLENYNLITSSTPRTNVTAGAQSISGNSYAHLFFTGHEYSGVGSNLMPFGMPKPNSPLLGFGNQAGSPTVDMLGITRPAGLMLCSSGTATAGANLTLTDSGKTWGTNVFAGCTVKIIAGTGSGQTKSIASNTATVLTVDGNWKTNPSTDSIYRIYSQAMSSSGTATAGSTTTLTDGNAAWGVNMWAGYTLNIDGGTGSPQSLVVVSNTATVLTFATATAPNATSTYKLYRGASENVINAAVGAYEYGPSGVKETTTVRLGSNSLSIPGAGYQDFDIPVNAIATTIKIFTRYNAYYSGTLPQMKILNGTEIGVADATAVAVGAADTWEVISLTFTPTSSGVITVRLLANSTTPTGNTFFDDFNVV